MSTTITEAKITGLENGISYSFKVYAVNVKGKSSDSNIVKVTPSGSSSAFLPEKITDLVSARGDGKVSLKWTPPFNSGAKISSYKIYYWQIGSDTIKTKDVTGDARTAQLTGLTNGVSYSVKVVAKNSHGHGPDSNVVSATPSKDSFAKAPNQVRGVNAIPSNNQVFLTWVEPSSNGSPITSYKVLVSEAGTNKVVTYPNLTGDTKTTITGLKNNVIYQFRIVAVNFVGESQPSGQVSATPDNRVAIEITNLKATRGDGSATLTWSIPVNTQNQISGYWIREYKTGESSFITHDIISSIPKARITGLENGVSYGFSVIAVTEAGIGPTSKLVQVTPFKPVPFPGAPAQITDLKVKAGENQAVLTWTAPNDYGSSITGYEIQQKIRGDSKYTSINHDPVTSVTITGLTSGVTYDFLVMAKNSAGIGLQSNSVSVVPIQKESAISIPSWIKTNAEWWSQNKISDIEYVRAIEYLINEGIIKLK